MNSRTRVKGMGCFVTILFSFEESHFLSGIHLNTWKYNVYIITLENKSVVLAWVSALVYVNVFGK